MAWVASAAAHNATDVTISLRIELSSPIWSPGLPGANGALYDCNRAASMRCLASPAHHLFGIEVHLWCSGGKGSNGPIKPGGNAHDRTFTSSRVDRRCRGLRRDRAHAAGQ